MHEDILNGYRVMERTKMLTDGRTEPCHYTSVFFFFFFVVVVVVVVVSFFFFKTAVYKRKHYKFGVEFTACVKFFFFFCLLFFFFFCFFFCFFFFFFKTAVYKRKHYKFGVEFTACVQTPIGKGNRQNQTSANRTNARKAPKLALSSQSEVIAMLKGLKNTRTK